MHPIFESDEIEESPVISVGLDCDGKASTAETLVGLDSDGSVTTQPESMMPETNKNELAVADGSAKKPNASQAGEWVQYAAMRRIPLFAVRPEKPYGVRINPRVTIATTLIVWIFLLVCLFRPAQAYKTLDAMKKGITEYFSWLYIGSLDAWIVFVGVLFFSKYSNIKLGDDDEEPEYGSATWFMMLFSCGVSSGLFYFGVNEPLTQYVAKEGSQAANRYSHLPSDERAQWAMNVVWYHWGLHGWIGYTVVALLMGVVGYRKKLPVTMRSCFYPLLGEKVFGVLGDAIDTLSASCTLFGVCVSLGLGVTDVTAGIHRLSGCPRFLNRDDCNGAGNICHWKDFGRCTSYCDRYLVHSATESKSVYNLTGCAADVLCSDKCAPTATMGFQQTTQSLVILIWVICSIAAVSVLVGMKRGIRAVAVFCFGLGMFFWIYVFLSDQTQYFLDVFIQQTGLYLTSLIPMALHTDAYARHLIPEQEWVVQNGTLVLGTTGANGSWFHNWTMFYWGWWVAWAPFVGMFIAKISRGRTIRQVIIGAMTAPALYCFLWFTCFGGSGLRMERMAASIDLKGHESPVYLTRVGDKITRDLCDPESGSSDCVFVSRLSQRDRADQWMDMISSFHGLETFMVGLSLIAILLYFVTSSDSGTLVVDALCSNGHEDPPIPQKLYWSIMVAATATALVVIGTRSEENNTLETLQSASVCCGLPYSVMLCFMCLSLWKACGYDSGDLRWKKEHFFKTDLTDAIDIRCTKTWLHKVGRVCLAAIAPWYYLRSAIRHFSKSPRRRVTYLVMAAALFYLIPFFMILYVAGVLRAGLVLAGWCYFCFGVALTLFRGEMRQLENIDGDVVEDALAVFLVYSLVCEQLDAQFEKNAEKYEQ